VQGYQRLSLPRGVESVVAQRERGGRGGGDLKQTVVVGGGRSGFRVTSASLSRVALKVY
jgi:hypothetical protein